jgi:D-beta-D-heptose 7-phosphate kinase / D-beta-D-heptose 1-phosphate adenosyltransferase
VVAEAERARLVAALAAVDCVVLFDEDTPLTLIRLLRPDVLVKGADYARETIVGAKDVEGWGGRVVQVPLVKDKSTTRLLERLRRG